MVYYPEGVCSKEIHVDVIEGIVRSLEFVGGCNGNLKGVSILARGREAQEVIGLLKNVKCGSRPTSCPAQLALALKKALEAGA